LRKKSPIIMLIFGCVLPGLVFAGISGKIAGQVKDAATGEPLPGCNLQIVGTTLGAASNSDGDFFILNVPPGQYQVRATMMGYQSFNYKNVQVMSDFTTRLNFELKTTVLELGEEVTIVAERPLVQKDITSKVSIVSSREIANMPVNDFQDVLTTKAGFTRDASGEIHVRGGRSGEISYQIDGMIVQDPLYGGFKSMVNEDAIDEMVVLSGTFNAEYGNAMSSVVNIVTKEGNPDFSGKLEYTSPMLNASPYRKQNPFGGVQDSYEYIEKSI